MRAETPKQLTAPIAFRLKSAAVAGSGKCRSADLAAHNFKKRGMHEGVLGRIKTARENEIAIVG